MINYRELVAADQERWEKFIGSQANASPYHKLAWGDAIQQAYGHSTLNLLAEANGNIEAVLPLVKLRVPFGKGLLCSLPYCDVGGVISTNTEAARGLVEKAREMANSLKLPLEIRSRDPEGTAIESTTDSDAKVSMLLAMPDNSEMLANSFKSKLRSQIRKSEKNGLTFRAGNDPDTIAAFYHVFVQRMHELGSPTHSKRWFECICHLFGSEATIGIVEYEKEPIGAGITLRSNRSVAIPWAATVSRYNRLSPNMLLYWNLLRLSCDEGAEVFDFGRSTFGEGTFKFKAQWGAQPYKLDWHQYTESGPANINQSASPGSLRKLAESTWRKLPLSVTTQIGPRIRKYISL